MEAKKVKAEIIPAKSKEVKELQAARKRLETVQALYRDMQRDWFKFASSMKHIRDVHDHDILGVESFQKLCEREFPSMSYSLVSKFIQIVEKIGDQIEKRLEASDDYRIPTYETCYELTTVQKKVSEEDYKRFAKQVLDDKLSVRAFREKIKAITEVAKKDLRKRIDEETEQFMDKTQKELDADLRNGGIGDDDEAYMVDPEDFEPEDHDDEDADVDDDADNGATIVALTARFDYLIENLPDFAEQVESLDAPTKALIKKMKKLGSIIDETVETLNEV
jgi:hypothetical protein